MVIKIVIEIVVGFILLYIGTSFWFNIKSIKYMKWILSDYNILRRFFNHDDNVLSESWILANDSVGMLSDGKNMIEQSNYRKATDYFLFKVGFNNYKKMRNIYFIISIIIIQSSLLMGVMFYLINILLFSLTIMLVSNKLMHLVAMGTLQRVYGVLAKWHRTSPNDCNRYCTKEQSKLLSNIYMVISEV
jgi:hypothetical protein